MVTQCSWHADKLRDEQDTEMLLLVFDKPVLGIPTRVTELYSNGNHPRLWTQKSIRFLNFFLWKTELETVSLFWVISSGLVTTGTVKTAYLGVRLLSWLRWPGTDQIHWQVYQGPVCDHVTNDNVATEAVKHQEWKESLKIAVSCIIP